MSYNHYRHRHYNLSRNQRRHYAKEMEELQRYFNDSPDWSISSHLDSCYKIYPDFELRLSNRSVAYKHDVSGKFSLLVNISTSKQRFIDLIENKVDDLVAQLQTLPLENYRYINIVNGKIHCFLKNYKTKEEIFEIRKAEN